MSATTERERFAEPTGERCQRCRAETSYRIFLNINHMGSPQPRDTGRLVSLGLNLCPLCQSEIGSGIEAACKTMSEQDRAKREEKPVEWFVSKNGENIVGASKKSATYYFEKSESIAYQRGAAWYADHPSYNPRPAWSCFTPEQAFAAWQAEAAPKPLAEMSPPFEGPIVGFGGPKPYPMEEWEFYRGQCLGDIYAYPLNSNRDAFGLRWDGSNWNKIGMRHHWHFSPISLSEARRILNPPEPPAPCPICKSLEAHHA